jgi:hypothetical protein
VLEATPEELRDAVIDAVVELLAMTGSTALQFPIPGTKPTLFVIAGDEETIRSLLGKQEKPN